MIEEWFITVFGEHLAAGLGFMACITSVLVFIFLIMLSIKYLSQ